MHSSVGRRQAWDCSEDELQIDDEWDLELEWVGRSVGWVCSWFGEVVWVRWSGLVDGMGWVLGWSGWFGWVQWVVEWVGRSVGWVCNWFGEVVWVRWSV